MSVEFKDSKIKASIALGKTIASQGFSWKLKAYLRNVKMFQGAVTDLAKFTTSVVDVVKEREKLNLELRKQDLALKDRKINGLKQQLVIEEKKASPNATVIDNIRKAIAKEYGVLTTTDNYANVDFSCEAIDKIQDKIEEVQKLTEASKAVGITFGAINAVINFHYKYVEYKILDVVPNPITSEMLTNLAIDRGRNVVAGTGIEKEYASYFDFDLVNYAKYNETRELLSNVPLNGFTMTLARYVFRKRFDYQHELNKTFDDISADSAFRNDGDAEGTIRLNKVIKIMEETVNKKDNFKFLKPRVAGRDLETHTRTPGEDVTPIKIRPDSNKTYFKVVQKYDIYEKNLKYLAFSNKDYLLAELFDNL